VTKRIVHLIPTLDRGGAEKQLTLLAAGLDPNEFEVHVGVLTRTGPLAADLAAAGIPVTCFGKKLKADPWTFGRLYRWLRTLKPDLVQTWLFAANSYGRAASWLAGVPQIVASERCVDRWKRWPEHLVDRVLSRCSKQVVVNSPGVLDYCWRHGLPKNQGVIIPNGVPDLNGSVPAWTRAELLAELGLPANAQLIGAVGRLWPQKRIHDLIWAADLLKVIRPEPHLLILGDGPQWDALHRYRRQIEIEDRVHFLGARNDVARILPHLLCLWLGSGYEGQPNCILEAMIAGRPVVATDIPGNRDLVIPEETGYLVPVGDRAAFARHTRRLLDQPELAEKLGQAGRQRALHEFSVERLIQRYTALYRDLLG